MSVYATIKLVKNYHIHKERCGWWGGSNKEVIDLNAILMLGLCDTFVVDN